MIVVLCAAASLAVDVGIGIGGAFDTPDPASADHARLGPGLELAVPVWLDVAPAARLRVDLRADLASGTDLIVWEAGSGDSLVRVHDGDLPASLVSVGALLGADALLSASGATPYLGAGLGMAVATVSHADVGEDGRALVAATGGGSVQPRTTQVALVSELRVGVDLPLGKALDLWAETGYAVAFLRSAPLREAPPAVTALRQPIGWNAVRAMLGVSVAVGGSR